MSVLVRRAGDTRAQFSQGWLSHGRFIADLPGLRGYVQNHVEEEFALPGAPFLHADGFVELRFDSPDAMAQAFNSPAACAMAMDEPNFLGHGSGYALRADTELHDAESGNKLILAMGGNPPPLEAGIADWPMLRVIRDEVAQLIPKPGMAVPQPVSSFWHLLGADAPSVREAAQRIARAAQEAALPLAIFRVRTVRFA